MPHWHGHMVGTLTPGSVGGDPPLTVHSRTHQSTCSQGMVSSEVVLYEKIGPENQKWLPAEEGKDRMFQASFSGSQRSLQSLVSPWNHREPFLIGELDAETSV